MALDEDITALRKAAFFATFDEDALRLIAFGSTRLSFVNGAEIFREGQPSDGGYVVLDGSVRLHTASKNGTTQSHIAGPGQLIGELALITQNFRLSDAYAAEDSVLLKIRREPMLRVLEEYPHIAARIHNELTSSISAIGKDLDAIYRRLPNQ